jgi:lipoate-protein ligase A
VEILAPERPVRPEWGFGLQQAVLEEIAARGEARRGPTALVWTSTPYVAATRLETRLAGFDGARRISEGMGFPVLVRNSGGGAVAANEGSVSFSLTFPVEEMRSGLYERYETLSALIVSALARLGVEAEPGEVDGEFCPGAYSVRVGGPRGIKVAGLAQRVTRRAARVEALILVEGTAELRPVLSAFYGALGLPFRLESVGDLLPPEGVDGVVRALVAEARERYRGGVVPVGEALLSAARERSGIWGAGSSGGV